MLKRIEPSSQKAERERRNVGVIDVGLSDRDMLPFRVFCPLFIVLKLKFKFQIALLEQKENSDKGTKQKKAHSHQTATPTTKARREVQGARQTRDHCISHFCSSSLVARRLIGCCMAGGAFLLRLACRKLTLRIEPKWEKSSLQ